MTDEEKSKIIAFLERAADSTRRLQLAGPDGGAPAVIPLPYVEAILKLLKDSE
jgi:hypothetical protein